MDSFHMYPANIVAATFVFIISFCFLLWKKSRKNSKSRTAPEPVGAWPLIGHLRLLIGPELPHVTLGNLADKYGPALAIRLGVRKTLVVSSWEVAKECYTTNDKSFATRPSSVAVELMGYNYALFGLGPYGAYWREVRKITILELLSNHRLESLKHVWISEISGFVKELYQLCVANGNTGRQSALVEMRQWLNDLTLNVSVRMVVGKRYFGSGSEHGGEDVKRFQKAIKDFFRLAGKFTLADAIPFLRWLDFGHEKAMKKNAKELDYVLAAWLDEHQKNKCNGKTKVDQDFMDVMLTVLGDGDLYGYKADVVNKATCLNLILGGVDTTTVTLTWALSLLLNNPHILKKAQDEICVHIGNERQVEDTDLEKLVYLHAIVKETMRLYPPVPLSGPREAVEDCRVAGYHIPLGTRLIVNTWKIQRDPEKWHNPSEFRAERFLTTHANVDVRGQHFELIPFGSGRRVCPGISFALQMVHLTLARLLQGFNFETPSNAAVDMTESPGMTNFKASPLEVLVTPVLPSNFY